MHLFDPQRSSGNPLRTFQQSFASPVLEKSRFFLPRRNFRPLYARTSRVPPRVLAVWAKLCGGKKKKKKRPDTPASFLWTPETTRHEPKISMAEKLVDVFVKLRQRGKKDQPPKLYVVTVTMLIFMIKRTI